MMHRFRGPLLAALALALALTGCDGDAAAAPSPQDQLRSLPGVTALHIDSSVAELVVDVDADATAAQVADVLRAMAGLRPGTAVLYLGAGPVVGSDESDDLTVSLVDARPTGTAALLADNADSVAAQLTSAAALGDHVAVSIEPGSGNLTASVDVTGETPENAQATVSRIFASVAQGTYLRNPTMSVTGHVVGPAGVRTVVAAITAPTGVDPVSRALVDARWLGSDERIDHTTVRRDLDGRRDLSLAFRINDQVDSRAVTRRSRTDLWRLLQIRLVTMNDAPAGSTFTVHLSDSRGLRSGDGGMLVELTVGAEGLITASPDPLRRGWGRAAVARLV